VRSKISIYLQSSTTSQQNSPSIANASEPAAPFPKPHPSPHLTVRFLESGSGSGTSKLLRLTTSVIGHQQGSVVSDKLLLYDVLASLINVLLVVGDNGLGDGLTDGVDLRCVSTARNSDADVDLGELVEAD